MVLFASGRTDIPAFYSKWFMNRVKEGFFDVRNPYNPKLVSRIYMEDVDIVMFCSKNPEPIVPYLKDVDKPIVFHITLTPYVSDIEPGIKDKRRVIESIKEISSIIGIENVFVRYDPIFLSKKYDLDFHLKGFTKMCELLDGYVQKIIVSFIDDYKNVRQNRYALQRRDFEEADYRFIGENFSRVAASHNMTVQTCFEDKNLVEYGFIKGDCLSHEFSYKLTGKTYKNLTSRKGNKCSCVSMADIGVYNTCKHFCKYCYANYDEKKVMKNLQEHDENSSLLFGHLESDDVIKVRK